MVSDNEWAEEENKGDSSFWRRKDKMDERNLTFAMPTQALAASHMK